MKIDPNEPAMPIKDIGFIPHEDGGDIAFETTQGAFNVNYTGITIRAELAARNMAALLSDRSNLDAFPKGFSMFDSRQKLEDKSVKAMQRFLSLMGTIAVMAADALIAELNKEQ